MSNKKLLNTNFGFGSFFIIIIGISKENLIMKNKPRAIVTTDMECDDMNSLMHMCLYLNEIDLEGMIYTSSKFHFNGDGVHTLGEVEPDYRCFGNEAWTVNPQTGLPGPSAKDLKEYRPFETDWIENLWKNGYAKCLDKLNENGQGYPSVDYLMSITCLGNVAFEGDVREETPGSRLIENAILKEDDRPLYLLSWGGANTIVRALMSIYEKYHEAACWQSIYKKVNDTVRIFGIVNGVGQDNSWLKYGKPLFPDLKLLSTEFVYGTYLVPMTATKECNYMFHADWLKENIKVQESPLMKDYGLMGDGKYYPGEPDDYQYGLHPVIDWHFPGMPAFHFDAYDFLGEGDSATYIPLLNTGLRGLENGDYGSVVGRIGYDGQIFEDTNDYITGKKGKVHRFLKSYQEEFAARVEWTYKDYSQCSHAPKVTAPELDYHVSNGDTISLNVNVESASNYGWYIYDEGCIYSGDMKNLRVVDPLSCSTLFTIPQDAKEDDRFVLIFEARGKGNHPISRYAQIVVHVDSEVEFEAQKNPLSDLAY